MLSSDESSRPWWVPLPWKVLWLFSSTEGCCGVSAHPSISAAFCTGAMLAKLLMACAQWLRCETGPAISLLRDVLKTQALPAFIWEPSWHRGWRVTFIYFHWLLLEKWISYWIFFPGSAFIDTQQLLLTILSKWTPKHTDSFHGKWIPSQRKIQKSQREPQKETNHRAKFCSSLN